LIISKDKFRYMWLKGNLPNSSDGWLVYAVCYIRQLTQWSHYIMFMYYRKKHHCFSMIRILLILG
jgi:hypothetical protein